MESYYCTNCGAVLDNQYGFNPNNHIWKCEECGTVLYGNDIYEGDSFPGVMWICDNCGSLLNVQDGFYDECGKWYCNNCGYKNDISEESIINRNDNNDDDDDNDNDDDSMRDKCPYCKCNLKESFPTLFLETNCICPQCGLKLSRNYSYEDFETEQLFACPNCDSILNLQDDFDNYCKKILCASCNSWLIREYSFDDFELDERFECPNCGEIINELEDYTRECLRIFCSNCNTYLCRDYENDEFEDERLCSCPSCGEILNEDENYEEQKKRFFCQACESFLKYDFEESEFVLEKVYHCPICKIQLNQREDFEDDLLEFFCDCGSFLTRENNNKPFVDTEYIANNQDYQIHCSDCSYLLIDEWNYCPKCGKKIISNNNEKDQASNEIVSQTATDYNVKIKYFSIHNDIWLAISFPNCNEKFKLKSGDQITAKLSEGSQKVYVTIGNREYIRFLTINDKTKLIELDIQHLKVNKIYIRENDNCFL